MNDRTRKDRQYYRTAFFLNLAAGIFSFAWTIIAQRGLFSLAGDFDVQQIPFAMYANDAIKSGNVIWDWSLDLGSNFIGGMSFYILGNPSFWVSLLFPSRYFMYIVGWLYVLKYAFAGLTSFAWIRRHVSDESSAVVASLMYAFSGYMAEDLLFYHFHDVVALFPLLLLGFDLLMQEGKRGPFLFAVLFNAIVNYYFLVGDVIFLAAYYVLRYFVPEGKKSLKGLFQGLFEAVLGCMLGLWLLLPSFFFVIQNPRVKMDYHGSNSLVFGAERYLYILKGLLFPGEVMSDQSAVIAHNFASCSAYIPMVGLVLVIAWLELMKGRKHWMKRMLLFCLVTACVPILNAAFSLFAGLYHRWYYMPTLLFALCGAMVLERKDREDQIRTRRAEHAANAAELRLRRDAEDRGEEIPEETLRSARREKSREVLMETLPSERAVRKGAVIWGCIALAFIFFLLFVKWSDSEPSKIYHIEEFTVWSCVCLLGILLTWLFLVRLRSRWKTVFVLSLYFFAIFTMGAAVFLYQTAHAEDARHHYDRLLTSGQISCLKDEYRVNSNENPETLTHGFMASGNFCSTVSGSIFRFYEALGLKRDVRSPDPPEGLAELVSARYTFEEEAREEGEPVQAVEGTWHSYYVYEDPSVAPIGFTYDTYMTYSDFLDTNKDNRAILMLKTLVIPDEKEEVVSRVLRRYSAKEDGSANKEHLSRISASHLEEAAEDVSRTTDSYSCTIRAASDSYAFFSIPNDSGWKASVNGEEQEILDICGFMAVPVSAGENRIVFTYTVPGLAAGILGTLAGALITAVYLVLSRKMKKREAQALPADEGLTGSEADSPARARR